MPTYVYRCQGCDTLREAVQKITADPLTTCESCGGAVRRVVQPVGIVFKGTGFYVTDYKRVESSANGKNGDTGNGKNVESSGDKPADSSTGKAESAESKPTAPKTEKKDATPAAAAT